MSCKKLIFTLEEGISVENSILWGVREFVRFAGEAVLADMLQRELALDLERMKSRQPEMAETGETTAPAPAAEPEPAEAGISIPHFPVKINVQTAIRTAGIQGAAKLRFIPYWLFHYTSTGEQVYRDRRIPFDADGWGAINAINGIRIELDSSQVETGEVSGSAEVVDPHIAKEDAREKIVQELMDRLTQRVRIKQEKGDAIFYEEKILKPDRKNITVDFQQVFIPVWQIRARRLRKLMPFPVSFLPSRWTKALKYSDILFF
jgi:hypothetical protein